MVFGFSLLRFFLFCFVRLCLGIILVKLHLRVSDFFNEILFAFTNSHDEFFRKFFSLVLLFFISTIQFFIIIFFIQPITYMFNLNISIHYVREIISNYFFSCFNACQILISRLLNNVYLIYKLMFLFSAL